MSDDYDPDEHGYGLEDVCDRLDNIEAAVAKNHWDTSWVGWAVVMWLAIFFGLPDMWWSKTRISWWYSLSTNQVTIEKKPTDCNFFHAPLGDKDCHFDPQVSVIKVDNSNAWGGQSISYDGGIAWTHTAKNKDGVPIVSHDGGITWSTESVPAHTERMSRN